ncbi:MAG: lipopolysaccharide kinase InaA family protein [Candidatus Brocadiales bacterium]
MQKLLRKNAGGITWYVPENEAHNIGDKLEALDDPLSEDIATVHKKGRRKVFASLRVTAGGEELYLKVFRLTGLSLKLKHLFLRSKAMRELMTGLTAVDRGVPAVVPLAAGEKKRMGLIEECYVLLKKIDSAVNLRDFLGREDILQRQRSRVIESLGRLARKSHENGIFQTDFSLNNFLLKDPGDPVPIIYIIDFERTYVRGPLSKGMRDWTLAKLNRVGGGFSITDKLRFLIEYVKDDKQKMEKPAFSAWINGLDRQTHWILRRDALRIHGTCVRSGRGYKSYTEGSLRAYFLKDHNVEELKDLAMDAGAGVGYEDEPAMEVSALTHDGQSARFNIARSRKKIVKDGVETELDIYRFIPGRQGPTAARPAMVAWQAANALIKANVPVSQVVAAIETGEGPSYRGHLVVKRPAGLKYLGMAVGESLPDPGRTRALLWHSGRLLARLHNHGVMSAPVSAGDIGVRESPSGRMTPYLMRPFRFTMDMTGDGVSAEDRRSDLEGLELFLRGFLGKGEVEFLRRSYRLHSSNIPSHGETPCSYTPGIWSTFRFL